MGVGMDQTQQLSNNAQSPDDAGTLATAPALGLGVNPTINPNPSVGGPTGSPVVLPGDAAGSASMPTDDSSTPQIVTPQITTTHAANNMADDPAASTDSNTPDSPDTSTPLQPTSPMSASGLDDIKRQALEQLSPLVNQLEQAPEERYKTLMMMIQASDNDSLINEAYAAAQKISDEKARAEALLNIVNEINYFAQKNAAH